MLLGMEREGSILPWNNQGNMSGNRPLEHKRELKGALKEVKLENNLVDFTLKSLMYD